MKGTIIPVALPILLIPPKITAAVNIARTNPVINGSTPKFEATASATEFV